MQKLKILGPTSKKLRRKSRHFIVITFLWKTSKVFTSSYNWKLSGILWLTNSKEQDVECSLYKLRKYNFHKIDVKLSWYNSRWCRYSKSFERSLAWLYVKCHFFWLKNDIWHSMTLALYALSCQTPSIFSEKSLKKFQTRPLDQQKASMLPRPHFFRRISHMKVFSWI